jgi:hypothetical protein
MTGSVAVFLTRETEQGVDLNADGDLNDRVLQVYEAEAGTLISGIERAAEEFVLGERIVAFRTSECAEGGNLTAGCPEGGTDLNGDGDAADHVLHVYDLFSGYLLNTGRAVIPCRLESCDPRVPYRVLGETVTFLTLEADQGGKDLDGDGNSDGLVLQVFNAREVAEPVARAQGRRGTRISANSEIALSLEQTEVAVNVLAGSSVGICADTAEA